MSARGLGVEVGSKCKISPSLGKVFDKLACANGTTIPPGNLSVRMRKKTGLLARGTSALFSVTQLQGIINKIRLPLTASRETPVICHFEERLFETPFDPERATVK